MISGWSKAFYESSNGDGAFASSPRPNSPRASSARVTLRLDPEEPFHKAQQVSDLQGTPATAHFAPEFRRTRLQSYYDLWDS